MKFGNRPYLFTVLLRRFVAYIVFMTQSSTIQPFYLLDTISAHQLNEMIATEIKHSKNIAHKKYSITTSVSSNFHDNI